MEEFEVEIVHIREYTCSEGWLNGRDEIKDCIKKIVSDTNLKCDPEKIDQLVDSFYVGVIGGNPKSMINNVSWLKMFNPGIVDVWVNIVERCIIYIISRDLSKEWFKYILIMNSDLLPELTNEINHIFIELYF